MSDLLSELPAPVDTKITTAMINQHMAQAFTEEAGYATLFEVANGTGARGKTTFADIVIMNLWPSRGMELVGYEVKSDRGDWLRELKDPAKAWPVMQYCDRWILLSAPAVARLEEIPLNWGWTVFDGEKLREKKKAPVLEPKPLNRTFVGSMLRRPVRDVEAMVKQAVRKREDELEAEVKRRVEAAVAKRASTVDEALAKVAAIKEATGIDLMTWRTNEETVASALKFAMSADPFHRYTGLNNAAREIEGALKTVQALQAGLAEFMPAEQPPTSKKLRATAALDQL